MFGRNCKRCSKACRDLTPKRLSQSAKLSKTPFTQTSSNSNYSSTFKSQWKISSQTSIFTSFTHPPIYELLLPIYRLIWKFILYKGSRKLSLSLPKGKLMIRYDSPAHCDMCFLDSLPSIGSQLSEMLRLP